MSRKRDARITLTQSFISSTIAGYSSKTLTAPFDVIKIRFQVGTPDTRHGLKQSVCNVYYREGIRGFWKGNAVACLRLLPYSIIQLTAFQRLRSTLSDDCGRSQSSALIAGASAGLLSSVVMYPTDLVKTRLIIQHSSPKWAHYGGIAHAFQEIFNQEGFQGLYRGISTTLFTSVLYTSVMFLTYEYMSKLHRDSSESSAGVAFGQGCVAAALAQTVAYPIDTIRKKMQAYSLHLPNRGGGDINAKNLHSAYIETILQYGYRGLWRGLTVNLLKIVPYTGVMFYVFESCKRMFLYHNGYTLNPFQEVHHPLVDQSLKPQEIDEEETDDWFSSEED